MMTQIEFQKLYEKAQRKQARGDFVDALNDYLKLAENVVRIKFKWYCSESILSVYSADIDADGQNEIIAGSADGNVYALKSDGQIKWKCKTGGSVNSVFCADVDADGKVEVIAGNDDKKVYLLTSDGIIKGKF